MAAFAFFLFGTTPLIVKPSLLSPSEIVFLRFLVTAIGAAILIFVSRTPWPRPNARQAFGAAATSAAVFLNMICLFGAFRRIPISLALPVFYVGPVVSILFSYWIWRRRIVFTERVACAFALAGLALLWRGAYDGGFTVGSIAGYALALLGGFLFALIAPAERLTHGLVPTQVLFLQALFATLALAPFCAGALGDLSPGSLRTTLILSLLCTLAPFWLWWRALRIDPDVSPLLAYFDPLTGVFIGLAVFGERLSPVQAVAFACLAVAVMFPVVYPRYARGAPSPGGIS